MGIHPRVVDAEARRSMSRRLPRNAAAGASSPARRDGPARGEGVIFPTRMRASRKGVKSGGANPGHERPAGWLDSQDPAMRRVVELAERVARSQSNVLIVGESGSGKSVLAR